MSYLASERKEILVEKLGREAVAGVLLGSLDVVVDLVLRLEPLAATLVGTGEWTLARVIHHVQLEVTCFGKSRRAARFSAGITRRHSRMLRFDVLLQTPSFAKRCPTVSTDEWSLAQMNSVNMHLEITALTEKLSASDALESLLLEMDSLVVALHVHKLAEDFAAG